MTNEENKDNRVLTDSPGGDGQPAVDGNGRDGRPVDEASLSISNALRTSFLALKLVLLALVVMYLGSGYFTLSPGHKAVVVQFGRIQGQGSAEGPVLSEGAHWSWPWPISQVLQENTEKTRVLPLDTFWFGVLDPRLKGLSIDDMLKRASPPEMLQPGIDGYLLTGEQEIIHLKCEVRYKIADLVKYVTNVNTAPRHVRRYDDPEPVAIPGEAYLVKTVADWACNQTVARMRTDEIVRGDDAPFRGAVKQLMQQRLDDLDSGIEVSDLVVEQRTVPLQVRSAYLAVVQAESRRSELIANARRDATQKLYEVAGATHEELSEAIRAYELARQLGNQDDAAAQEQKIMELLDKAGGLVASAIGSSRAESSRRVEQIKAETNRFLRWYPTYRQNPGLFRAQYWAQTRMAIFNSPEVEFIFLPPGDKEIRLNLGHNPNYLKNKEVRRYSEQVNQ